MYKTLPSMMSVERYIQDPTIHDVGGEVYMRPYLSMTLVKKYKQDPTCLYMTLVDSYIRGPTYL